jgi:hypothetical protein
MILDIINDDMVGFANITAREMLDHLFMTYGNITAVDLENNFEQMHRAWDPQQPVESLFKQIQYCADYFAAGGVIIGHPQQINVGYDILLATRHFMSACCRWNENPTVEKNLGTIQNSLRRRTPTAQTNARRICSYFRVSCSKRRCGSNIRSNGRSNHWSFGQPGHSHSS